MMLMACQELFNEYNPMGELTAQNDKSFEWDPWGRLLSVSDKDSTWSASYDALGRRLQGSYRKGHSAPLITSSFYDPESEFLELGVQVGSKRFWKVYGADGYEAVCDDYGNYATLLHQATGELACVIADGKTHAVKQLPNAYGYQEPSKAPTDLVSYAQSLSWQSLAQDPTGLIWMGARYYDPRSGRFISADPVAYRLCYDLYTYANGDPVNFRDPSGRFASQAYTSTKQTVMNVLGDHRVQGGLQMAGGFSELSFGKGL